MKKSFYAALLFVMTLIFADTSFATLSSNNIQNFDHFSIAVLDINANEKIYVAKTMSFVEFYTLLETHGEEILREEFPHAAFAFVYFDNERNRLFYTTPEEILAIFSEKQNATSYWHPSFFTVLEKANRALIESGNFCILLSLWTAQNIIIPGSLTLYHGTKEIGAWLTEKIKREKHLLQVEA